MDFLTVTLCLSIGNAVAWPIALYTNDGVDRLLGNLFLATGGAFLCALVIGWAAPWLGVIGLVTAGPPIAYLAVLAGRAIRRAFKASTP